LCGAEGRLSISVCVVDKSVEALIYPLPKHNRGNGAKNVQKFVNNNYSQPATKKQHIFNVSKYYK